MSIFKRNHDKEEKNVKRRVLKESDRVLDQRTKRLEQDLEYLETQIELLRFGGKGGK